VADPDLWALTDLATPWSVHVAVTLRVAEQLTGGPREIDALAAACGADADALARVLRQLIGRGLFEEPAPGRFALNEAARMLLGPPARHGLDLDGFGGRMAHAWGSLLTAVRTGRPAYDTIFGRPYWDDLAAHPAIAADFDALMGPGHGAPDPRVVADDDWSHIRTVVDVGGGTGSLLAEILRVHPTVRGTLVDLPETVARSRDVFAAAGVSDRASVSGQSFFDPLPPGRDLYIASRVLANWPDREVRVLLARMADAARPSGRVVIAGGVTFDVDRAAPELLMLVLVGGKARTLEEFRALARDAGLNVVATGQLQSGQSLVECRPAPALTAHER